TKENVNFEAQQPIAPTPVHHRVAAQFQPNIPRTASAPPQLDKNNQPIIKGAHRPHGSHHPNSPAMAAPNHPAATPLPAPMPTPIAVPMGAPIPTGMEEAMPQPQMPPQPAYIVQAMPGPPHHNQQTQGHMPQQPMIHQQHMHHPQQQHQGQIQQQPGQPGQPGGFHPQHQHQNIPGQHQHPGHFQARPMRPTPPPGNMQPQGMMPQYQGGKGGYKGSHFTPQMPQGAPIPMVPPVQTPGAPPGPYPYAYPQYQYHSYDPNMFQQQYYPQMYQMMRPPPPGVQAGAPPPPPQNRYQTQPPTPAPIPPTPPKPVSKAIKIVNPNTGSEVVLEKTEKIVVKEAVAAAPVLSATTATPTTTVTAPPAETGASPVVVRPEVVVEVKPKVSAPIKLTDPAGNKIEFHKSPTKPNEIVVEHVAPTPAGKEETVEAKVAEVKVAEVKEKPAPVSAAPVVVAAARARSPSPAPKSVVEPARAKSPKPEEKPVRAPSPAPVAVKEPVKVASPVKETVPESVTVTEKKVEEKVASVEVNVANAEPSAAEVSPSKPSITVQAPSSAALDADIPETTTAEESAVTGETIVSEPKATVADPNRTIYKLKTFEGLKYPAGLPAPSLAKNKFEYSFEFLLAFQSICTEKPASLPSMEADDNKGASPKTSRPSSGSGGFYGGSSGAGAQGAAGKRPPPNTPHVRGVMNTVPAPARAVSNRNSVGPGTPMGGGRSGQGSWDGKGQQGLPPRPGAGGQGSRGGYRQQAPQPQLPPEPPVEPLKVSANAWTPETLVKKKKGAVAEPESEEARIEALENEIIKKAKGFLNKLTIEKFDQISGHFLNLPITSPSILKKLIELIFDKALDEHYFQNMYGRLCAKLSHELPGIQKWIGDDPKANAFRRLLLNKCQEEFEKGEKWTKANDEEQLSRQERLKKLHEMSSEEKEKYAEEEYQRGKLKRRVLGNISFIGELFKLSMITEKIMHSCIKQLLASVTDPEEEEVESLCKLMTSVGEKLDHDKAKPHIDVYFKRIKELSVSTKLSSRVRFMLQDLQDMRLNSWKARQEATGPLTIAEIHAREEKKQQEKRTAANKFSLLAASPDTPERKTSIDEGSRPSPRVASPEPVKAASPAAKKLPKALAETKMKALVEEWLSIFSVDEVIAGQKELGSDEYNRELVSEFMNNTLDKKADAIKKTADLFPALINAKAVSAECVKNCLTEIIEILEDISIDIPGAFKHVGLYIARLAAMENSTFTLPVVLELSAPLVSSSSRVPPAPKLLSEILKELKASEGANGVSQWVKDGDVDLKLFWPAAKRSDDTLAEWMDAQDLSFLNPAMKLVKGLKTRLGRDGVDDLITWIESDFDAETRQSAGFVRALSLSVVRYLGINTVFANGVSSPSEITRELFVKQEEIIVSHKAFFDKYVVGDLKQELELEVLFACQAYWQETGFAKLFLEHLFRLFVKNNIVEAETVFAWEKNTSRETSSKKQALEELGNYMRSLK
ncbi:hypothetical protein HDU76_005808, partial [Blyttiomyces sp. JEL0837]